MRAAGILMPISSLPSPHGIGTIGAAAYDFVDFLKRGKQRYWQILPIGPTGYGDSPYQSFSAFATNHYFIDLDILVSDKLLSEEEVAKADFESSSGGIDYYKLFKNRKPLLEKAVARFNKNGSKFKAFKKENADWLLDYALFMSIKESYDHIAFEKWAEDIRNREEKALLEAKEKFSKQIVFWQVVQYIFYKQWRALKKYANKKGVSIIGDIPIYLSPDSADLWANPLMFLLDENNRPVEVAGCPPDDFSKDGQLWGNPLYDWDYHLETKYSWWISRMKYAMSIYDIVRIDHFRGFAGYYAIKAGAETARDGRWRIGPSQGFINALKRAIPNMKVIAEDLGFLTDDVIELLKESGFPGTKVLQFAFDPKGKSSYLPHNYQKNCVVYTGTHDNTTSADWEVTARKKEVRFCKKYIGVKEGEDFARAMVKSAMQSVSDSCIIPMADWLSLGADGRINTPSTLGANWQWRANSCDLSKELAKEIAEITKMYGRV